MKISLCMPVFGADRAKVFCDAVYSILLQGYDDVELVVKDGKVTEPLETNALARRALALLADRARVIVGPDRGIFHALNQCLQAATGDILYFMCSDDLLCPGALIAVNEVFQEERFGGPYWLYGKTISADYTGKTLGIDGDLTTYDKLLEHNRIGQPAVFWNRAMMEVAGMFDSRCKHSADYELWLRYWEEREPWFIDQTLGVFRHHPDQYSNVNALKIEVETARISAQHRYFSKEMRRARRTWLARHAYGSDGIPQER